MAQSYEGKKKRWRKNTEGEDMGQEDEEVNVSRKRGVGVNGEKKTEFRNIKTVVKNMKSFPLHRRKESKGRKEFAVEFRRSWNFVTRR